MKLRFSGLTLVLLFVTAPLLHAQAWTGILDPSRAIDWSNAGIPGGIPNRTTICATLNPGATSAQIDAAIAACPSGQVVFLAAGTYNISGGISFAGHSNVTLRGAGPTQTLLQFSSGTSCNGQGGDICLTNSTGFWTGSAPTQPGGTNSANWTSGYSQGTTQVTLDNTASLVVGGNLILDEAADQTDNGGAFVNDTTTYSQEGNGAGRSLGGIKYNQQQIVTVVAINGSTVTISPGLYMNNWRATQTPKAWWTGPAITMVSVENLTVDNTGSGDSIASGIYFYNCSSCWLENIRSIRGNRNHVWLYQSNRVVVRDSFFFGTQNSAEESYGVEWYISSDDLIENNIFDQIASPIMAGDGEGIVVGYNYTTDNVYKVSPAWMQASYSSHDAGDAMNLFEGNEFNGLNCDDIHGTSQVGTYFRNQLSGWQTGKTGQTIPILLMSYCRAYNIVGNVLGTPSYHNNYEASASTSASNCNTSIYQLGWAQVSCDQSAGPPPANDPKVVSTLLRWGNYDTVTNGVSWNATEIPTTGVAFINGNPVPQTHTLPNSFYQASRPSWWGSIAWPPIGPDVAGGSGPGSHSNPIPAQACYNGTAKDSSGILLFDAANCYGQSRPSDPLPPTNLRATVN
jgi:hypothetical protein